MGQSNGDDLDYRAPTAIRGYPTPLPAWKPVAAAALQSAPYNRICQIGLQTPAGVVGIGSGWRAHPEQIWTAAHVVAGRSDLRIRLAGETEWCEAGRANIPTDYYRPGGREQKCSAFDLASLPFSASSGFTDADFPSLTDNSIDAVAVGFSGGVLVEHRDSAIHADAFVAHNCHTDQEHSGCPVFTQGGLTALHLGLFAGSRRYLKPPASNLTGYLNSAVRLTAAIKWLIKI